MVRMSFFRGTAVRIHTTRSAQIPRQQMIMGSQLSPIPRRVPDKILSLIHIFKDAEAQKTERINEATAQVARFNAMYEEYIKNPAVTKQRMFYETMEEVLPDLKVVIESPNGNTQTFYPLESFTGTATGSSTENSTSETAQ